MSHPVAVVILAAGKGTRMNSALPKVLHRVAGRPMIHHVLAAVSTLSADRVVVVSAPGDDAVAEAVAPVTTVVQPEARGTGDAVRAALDALRGFSGTVLVAFGDAPLTQPETLRRLAAARDVREGTKPPAVVVLGVEVADMARYGRLLQAEDGSLERIVEFSEIDQIDRPVRLINGGLMAIDGGQLADLLAAIKPDNAKGEYYLTDIVEIARGRGETVAVVEAAGDGETVGVDSRAGLAEAEAAMQRRLRACAFEAGVTLIAPETVFLSHDTELGQDCIIHPHVSFGPGVKIGARVEIKSFSHIEGAAVAADAVVGPYARLRPGASIGAGAQIGNFVEVKEATIGAGAKANHLAYIGDAHVGAGSNVGAGVITCNYNGFTKSHTEIGDNVFIGSNSALVAPVAVGDGAMIGAGSVVSETVPADALFLTRPDISLKGGGARVFRERQLAAKPAKPAKTPRPRPRSGKAETS